MRLLGIMPRVGERRVFKKEVDDNTLILWPYVTRALLPSIYTNA